MSDQAQLGLASTEELLREVIARQTFGPFDAIGKHRCTERALLLAEMIGGMSSVEREYRTVDS